MTHLPITAITRAILIVCAILVAGSGSAFADKPSWAGGGKHEKNKKNEKHEKHEKQEKHEKPERYETPEKYKKIEQYEKHNDDWQSTNHNQIQHDSVKPSFSGKKYFTDQHRTAIREYYANNYAAGHCPPGLAKKNNGCRPPGLAKKWIIGQPLPRDVIFYNLPPEIVTNLGTPPDNYRFVRVASDILMITTGVGRVADAIDNVYGN